MKYRHTKNIDYITGMQSSICHICGLYWDLRGSDSDALGKIYDFVPATCQVYYKSRDTIITIVLRMAHNGLLLLINC